MLSVVGDGGFIAVALVYLVALGPFWLLLMLRRRALTYGQQAFDQFLNDNHLRPNDTYGFKIALDDGADARFHRIIKQVDHSGQTYYNAITVDLGVPMPEIVLDAKRNNHWLSSVPIFYKQNQQLHLEGDFNKYFDLYAPLKWDIEALSIITPDIMQTLIDAGQDFDLEITGGAWARLVISTPGYIGYKPDKLQALYDAFQSIFPEIEHKLHSLNIDADSPHSLQLKTQGSAYSYTLFGKQFRLYRSALYLWLAFGGLLGILYLLGIRDYVRDIGIIYLAVCMVMGFVKLQKNR